MAKLRCSCYPGLHGKFSGDILFVSFFISLPEAEWKPTEKQDVLKILWECKRFFEEEAGKRGIKLDVRPLCNYDVLDRDFPLPNKVLQKAEMEGWIERIFKKAGFKNHDDAVSYLKEDTGREPVFLFHYRLKGCSYCPHSGWGYRVAVTYFSHFAVAGEAHYLMEAREHRDEGIYAHELLHIFGASDLYPALMEDGNLMSNHYWELRLNHISNRTLEEIGWVSCLKIPGSYNSIVNQTNVESNTNIGSHNNAGSNINIGKHANIGSNTNIGGEFGSY